jgi:hypothetical protein
LEFLVPIFSLGRLGDGRHVGAAARNQNHDVAHDWNYHEWPQPRLALRQNRTIVLKNARTPALTKALHGEMTWT